MSTNYVEMLMEDLLDIERGDTYNLIEMVEAEAEYIQSCLETNSVVTEKANTKTVTVNKKEGVITRLINAVKNIFSKFVNKAKEIAADLAPFKKEYLEALDNISYEGIKLNMYPHWNVDMSKNILAIDKMIVAYNKYLHESDNDKSKEYPDNTIEDIIKNVEPFKAYYDADNAYGRIMMMKFSTGDNLNDYKAVEIPGNGKTVKDVCFIGRKFIESYDDVVSKLDSEKKKFEEKLKLLEKAEKDSQNRAKSAEAAKESFNPFLILENAYLSETDLCFCKDFNVLFEETTSNNNDDKKDDKPFSSEVTSDESGSGSNGNSDNSNSEKKPFDASSSAFKFLKNIVTIIITALTTALTVAEQRLYMYKNTIKSVVQQAKKNSSGAESKPSESKTSEDKTEEVEMSKRHARKIKKAEKKINKITNKYTSKAKK